MPKKISEPNNEFSPTFFINNINDNKVNVNIIYTMITTCLTGTVKEKNLTGTPILGYVLPGTQVNFYWDKIFSKNNWLGQKIGSKVDWDTILSRKIECDNNLSEIFGWDKML